MGLEQSPVNLKLWQNSSQLRPLHLHSKPTALTLRYDGRQLVAFPQDSIRLQFQQKIYDWQRMIFHSPSEHQVDHVNADVELQLEFVERESGEKLHLVIFIHEAQGGGNIKFGQLPGGDQKEVTWQAFQLDRWLPAKLQYFYYKGSQSYPPCSENISWLVLTEAMKIQAGDRRRLAAVVAQRKRPLQAMGQRVPLLSR